MTTTTAALTTDLADGILTITLSNPERRNPQSPSLWRALSEIGASLPAQARAVVLCADGPSFSAGLDRRMLTPEGIPGEGSLLGFATMPAAELDARISTYQEAFRWWRRCPAVTVAAVQGHAIGAGFQLALACDLIVVADDVRFGMKEPSLGLVPDLGGTLPLVAAVGYARALEIVASGRWVEADEAVRIGLALRAVPADQLDAAALEVARACSSALPDAIAGTKALLADAVVRADPAGGPDAATIPPGSLGAWAAAHDAQLAAERGVQGDRIRSLAAMLTRAR